MQGAKLSAVVVGCLMTLACKGNQGNAVKAVPGRSLRKESALLSRH